MNSNTILERNANLFPIAGRRPPKSALGTTRLVIIPPNLHIFSGSAGNIPASIYAYAIGNQQRNETFETVAFAVLAGSGIAGIVAAFI